MGDGCRRSADSHTARGRVPPLHRWVVLAALPDDAAPGAVFGTVVDGSPVPDVLLDVPLRVVLF